MNFTVERAVMKITHKHASKTLSWTVRDGVLYWVYGTVPSLPLMSLELKEMSRFWKEGE